MTKKKILAPVIIMVFTAFNLYASEKTLLKMQFEEGKVYNYELEQQQEIVQTLFGQKFSSITHSEMGMTIEIEEVLSDDKAVIATTYDYTTMKVSSEGHVLHYDSRDPEKDELGMSEVFDPILGKKLRITISSAGKVVETSDIQEMLQDLGLSGEDSPFNEMFDLEQMFEQMWAFYPENPVGIGNSWKREIKMDMPFSIILDSEYTLAQQDEQHNYITMLGHMSINMDEEIMKMEGVEFTMDFKGKMIQNIHTDIHSGWTTYTDSELTSEGIMFIGSQQEDELSMEVPMTMIIRQVMTLVQ